MSSQLPKGKRATESRKKDRCLAIVNSAVHAQLCQVKLGEPVFRVFYFKHPRTRNDEGTLDAVPTHVKIHANENRSVHAEPQSLRDRPVLGEYSPDSIATLERTTFTEQQRYMLMLMADPEIWDQSENFWHESFGMNDKSIVEARIKFLNAFKDGDLDLAWKVGHKVALDLLHVEEAEAERNGFWEMNDLINEPQRPARNLFEDECPLEHVYVVRKMNPDRSTSEPPPGPTKLVHVLANGKEKAHGGDKTRGVSISDADSITLNLSRQRQSSASSMANQRHQDSSFGFLPDPEELAFFARFPIPLDVAQKHTPPLEHNDRAQPAPVLGKQNPSGLAGDAIIEGRKTKRKKQKKKKPSQDISTDVTTAEMKKIVDEAPAVQFTAPNETAPRAKPCDDETNGAAETSDSARESLPQDCNGNHSNPVNTPTSSTPHVEGTVKSAGLDIDSGTVTAQSSSKMRGPLPSYPPVNFTLGSEDGSGCPTDEQLERNRKRRLEFVSAIEDYDVDNEGNPDEVSHQFLADMAASGVMKYSSDSLEASREKANGGTDTTAHCKPLERTVPPENFNRTVEKKGDVVFVYCTWIGLAAAKRGVRGLADTFGEEWVKKGILTYAIHDEWQLASL